MPGNNKENILCNRLEYTFLSLISNKVNVLIVGGGRAGFIKAKTLTKKGCNITVLAKDFCDEFKKISTANNIKLINGEYKREYIINNHIIIIAVNDSFLNKKIKEHCIELFKLYLDCSNFKEGLVVLPCQRETENINFAINTKGGNPKTSRYLAEKIKIDLKKYDEFVEYNCYIRHIVKEYKNKDEIMNFISSEDFYFFYKKDVHKYILKMFYGGSNFEINSCD
ncbi:NAD(P)-dependent oxidoreductase [Clostridium rectalis]|uniref:NAD(P)-dependent oxidoreductase n=1 Tax=Clostridium rectalis TaxID=2040295 RepID=UPI000F634548|nr:NAD(P)-dependent oxidoreductase [Clostridium rectalis]